MISNHTKEILVELGTGVGVGGINSCVGDCTA